MAVSTQTHEHDVLVIGAGGAGLRAAIEASAAGASVGLICKSLLGKAHTVMAEGGMAAAMAHVDDRDSWKVHFADTMRGGQYLNNWRMAELHAKEAPDRVRELEAWGAVFDRTKDGRILQRNFGGHRYPRLAHVGDRTGLEMIRTLQDHGIHQGIKVYMEHTITKLFVDAGRVAGALGYDRERGYLRVFKAKAIVLATGGVGRAFKITSNSWEYTGDGQALAYDAGADLMDMEFVQFHPTGMVWPPSVKGILVTEGVRGEGGVLRNKDGKRFMFDDIPDNYKGADRRQRGRGLEVHPGGQERAPAARAAHPRSRRAQDHERGARGARQPARRRVPRHRLDQGAPRRTAPSTSRRSCRACTTSSSSWPTSTSPRCRWRSGRPPTTSWAASASTATRRCRRCPGCSRRASARRACTAPTAWAATRCRTCWCSASGPASTPPSSRASAARSTIDEAQIEAASRAALAPFERAAAGGDAEAPYKIQYELQDLMQDNVGIVRNEADMKKALDGIQGLKRARRRSPSPATASTTPAGTRRSISPTCSPAPR